MSLAVLMTLAALFVLPSAAGAQQTSAPGISASPNPVPIAQRGKTTITWNAGPGLTAEVWVSVNQEKEALFAGASSTGSQEVDWIVAGSTYDFRLYQGTSHSTLLASVEVRLATEPASIKATPNPVETDAAGLNGNTRIEWNTGNGKPGRLYLSTDGGQEVLVAGGASGTVDVPYVRLDSSADFILYDESHKSRLAAVEVLPRMPRTRLVMLLTFGAALLFLIVGSLTQRDPAAFRRKVSPLLAGVTTAAALLPILTTAARPLPMQPFPDAHEYGDAAHQIVSGKGYVTYVHDSDTWPDDGQARPPKYPPGFSLALVPFAAVGSYPDNVLGAAKWFAALYLIAAVGAAWSLGGPLAGVLAAGLIGISPFGEQSAMVLLADAFCAALTVALLPLLNKPTPFRASVAGILTGLAVLVRFSMVVNIAALAVAMRGRTRVLALAWTAPALAGLFLFQGMTFGGPLKTGYGYWSPVKVRFSLAHVTGASNRAPGAVFADVMHGKLMRWVCPCPSGGSQQALSNASLYPALLVGLFWVFSPPLVALIGVVYLWRHRRAPPAAASICVIVLTLVLYAGHFSQSERFMAAPATLLAIFACVAVARWAERRSPATDVSETRALHPTPDQSGLR